MSRYLILLFSLLGIAVFLSTQSKAANDLEKWNSEQGRVARSAMRDKIATTTYREVPNHVDSSYRSTANGGKVLREIETNATVKGSRVGTTIEALKDVDKMGAAKKWAKELGKGGLRFTVGAVLIEAAMQEMLDGIGWVIDEGGKIERLPTDEQKEYENQHAQVLSKYRYRNAGGIWFYSHNAACADVKKNMASWAEFQSCSFNGFSGSWAIFKVSYLNTDNNKTVVTDYKFQYEDNPYYKPDSAPPPPDSAPVLEPEMIEKIRDYFENPKSSPSKDLLIEQAEKPKGKASIMWSDDPASEQTIYNDNKNTTDKVLKSDNPVADGLTKEVPKISDGTIVEGETTPKPDPNPNPDPNPPNPNPDPNPSNPDHGSTFNFKLPAFCDWASVVCDWIGWTKEQPELEGEKLDIEEQDITDYKYEDHVDWGSQCPFSEKTEILDYHIGQVKVKYNLDFFCDFGHKAKSTIVGLGHLGALIFLIIGIRSGASG